MSGATKRCMMYEEEYLSDDDPLYEAVKKKQKKCTHSYHKLYNYCLKCGYHKRR